MMRATPEPVIGPTSRRAGPWGPLLVAAMMLTGCNGFFSNREQVKFDGVVFRSKSEIPDKKDKKFFQVTVQPVSASLDGAREAGRWEGTRYCVRNYGSSRISWEIGPDTDVTSLPISDDRLTLRGRCDP